MLEEVGGHCEPRLRENEPCPIDYMPRHMHFAPAGMEMWGYTADMRFVKDATLTFDLAALGERLATDFDADAMATPRLRFADDRLWTLVGCLSDAVNDPDPSTQLYGDGLTAAIAARLFATPPEPRARRRPGPGAMAAAARRRVSGRAPAGARRSRASRGAGGPVAVAFQPGVQGLDRDGALSLAARRAHPARAGLLIDTHASLDQVAEATGFADAVHFGRTFRKLTGATPAAWRRDRTS